VEVILSLGAVNTPKVLMQSGIGDEGDLRRLGIPVVQHLPGVGRNLQDHLAYDCIWELRAPLPRRNNGTEAVMYWSSSERQDFPDMFACQAQAAKATDENVARYGLPQHAWSLVGAPAHPASRGTVQLTSADPSRPVRIDTNALSAQEDLKAARRCVARMREIGSATPLMRFVKREVMPISGSRKEIDEYVRNAGRTYRHLVGTAKMGTDMMSVVDGRLRTYGVERLRIADASIMPRITIGNTMAPSVVIGEQAADFVKRELMFGHVGAEVPRINPPWL
jgi:choline dehydrogenase